MKKLDLTGKKFGRLIVLKEVGRTKFGSVVWECICECGVKKNVSSGSLKRGNTKSCGCFRKEKNIDISRKNIIDISGQKFNRLTVIEYSHSKNRQSYWKCLCDCGNEIITRSNSLRSEHTKSCGCLMKEISAKNGKSCAVPILERLEKYIDKSSGSWIWIGNVNFRGYGKIKYNGKMWLVHRLIYELYVDHIPEGLCVCHKNDVPEDVTPSNLFLGTRYDNNLDKINKGRQPKGEDIKKSILTKEKVIEARNLYETGKYTYKEIGEKLGFHKDTIYDAIAGRTWRHVE